MLTSQYYRSSIVILLLSCLVQSYPVSANSGTATYLGNEALLVQHGDTKILFDPFFHNTYNIYQQVPKKIIDSLMSGQAPYDEIDYIFISHAHGDHFSAESLLAFLKRSKNTKLILPLQALNQIRALEGFEEITKQTISISLEYGSAPISQKHHKMQFDVVRIPHAGWPQRANISNLVFRVTLNDSITVVHMGDADPNDIHFQPLVEHWQNKHTNSAFPPYWFFLSSQGKLILRDRIAADQNIGLHVPTNTPTELIRSGERFFSQPTQQVPIHEK